MTVAASPDRGTTSEPISTTETLTLDVTGMKCAGCVNAVERQLLSQTGVRSACVNLVTEVATVECEPSVDPIALAQILTRAGFPSEPRLSADPSLREGLTNLEVLRQNQAQQQRQNLAIALVLLVISTIGHLSHAIGHPIPGLGNDWFHAGLAAAALLIPGRSMLVDGLTGLRHNAPNMNTLVGLGALTAFLTSLVALINPNLGWECFFDEPVMLIGFILLGRTLEQGARHRAAASFQALLALQPKVARLVGRSLNPEAVSATLNTPASAIEVPVEHLRLGEWVQVLPGEQIPIDGEIRLGQSTIEESMLTGESLPCLKSVGDPVYAGTLNQSGAIVLQVTRTGANTTLARIIQLVEAAQTRKAPIQRLADTVAGYFTYGVITLAIVTFGFWYFLGTAWWPEVVPTIQGLTHTMPHDHSHAAPSLTPLLLSLKLAIAVMVIACPCALGLATPTALLVGSSLGAENGLLIRGGDILEQVQTLDTIVFDKTGTLTQGHPTVTDIHPWSDHGSDLSPETLLSLAATVEQGTNHPLASAIAQAAQQRQILLLPADNFQTTAGLGIAAQVQIESHEGLPAGSHTVRFGNQAWLETHHIAFPPAALTIADELSHQGKTVIYGAIDQTFLGLLGIADPLRSDALQTVQTLQTEGLQVILLTGDRKASAQAVAQALSIPADRVLAEILPEGKSAAIAQLQAQGHRVGMIGDGINDAPALAQADVGIALRAGTEVAAETAGIVLVRDRLLDVITALSLSRQILRTIRQNLAWAFGYNLIAIPIAAGILLPSRHILLSPGGAGFLMALSSISVVLNSLLLRRKFHEALPNRLTDS